MISSFLSKPNSKTYPSATSKYLGPFCLVEKIVPTWERKPFPKSSRPAPTGRPLSEKAVWVLP